MSNCENCIHKTVCDLWHERERRTAGCVIPDTCELFESVKPLTARERAELQFYRSSELAPWQVRAMRETVREQKRILDGYQGDRVNADIRCGEAIAYLNHEIFPKMDYADYCALLDRIVSITDWENEVYGGSNKQYMRKSKGAAAEPAFEPTAGLRREESTEERT